MQSKREAYIELLSNEGYRPKIDGDGDIVFKVEGWAFLLYPLDDDPSYFRLSMPDAWEFERHEVGQVLRAANAVTRDYKIAKIVVVGERRVWINAELLLVTWGDAVTVLERGVTAILHARKEFIDQVRQQGPSISGHLGIH